MTLDEQIFVERGEIASRQDDLPLVSTAFRANVFWLGRRPLERAKNINSLGDARGRVRNRSHSPHRRYHRPGSSSGGQTVEKNQVAELTLRAKAPLAFDLSHTFETTGRFVIVDEYDISGGGIITELVHDEQEILRDEARRRDFAWVKGEVSAEARAQHYGHRAAIILFTGGRHTGKSFLARKLEAMLVAEGRHAYLLDAENLRRGLDADLAETDTAHAQEMVRRYGEVAHLLVDTGLILVSTTNPFALPGHEVAQSIRTLVHPTPLIAVHITKTAEDSTAEHRFCISPAPRISTKPLNKLSKS